MASAVTVRRATGDIVRVVRSGRPLVAKVSVPGPQGGVGPAGAIGPEGPSGLGQIAYVERVVEPTDVFAPNEPGQVRLVPNPALTRDFLKPPFAGHAFWVDDRIVGRALGDLYDVFLNLIVVSQIAGGSVRVEADVGSSLGPVWSDVTPLFKGALEEERVSLTLRVQVLDNFLANGCRLILTSTVPLTVTSETVVVAPASIVDP